MLQSVFEEDLASSVARVAAANASSTPSLVLAEHSKYLKAEILFPISTPSKYVT